jgi:hypothetical protein
MIIRENIKYHVSFFLAAALAIFWISAPAYAAAAKSQKTFSSPEKAVKVLVAAVKADNVRKLTAIFGPGSEAIVSSGDRVADREDRQKFLAMYKENHLIETVDPGKSLLILGKDKYPFPFPLVKKENRWSFDSSAGKDEILNRRIGRNELNAIQVCHAYVDAQREYAGKDRDGDGLPAFAVKFRSTPGKTDGLYWESSAGKEASPFGPLVAQAANEGYKEGEDVLSPYHGYIFRILTAQGEGADGGAFDYMVKGKMVLGFALIAYPAQYGASGIMTFIVNQGGSIYQKDMGPNSAQAAQSLKVYAPDSSWKKLD